MASASVKSIPFLSFIVPTFAWNVPLVSLIFLKRFLVFPILLFSSMSLHWSPRKAFLSLLAILWNPELRWVHLSFSPLPFLSLLFTAICKGSLDNPSAFLLSFSWEWPWFLPSVQCHKLPSIVLQALCLSYLIPWIYFSLLLYNHKEFDLGHLSNDYMVEVRNRFKGLDLIDRVPDKLWMEVCDIVQETGSKTIPKKKKQKMAVWGGLTNSCEKREAKNKGEKERYTHLIGGGNGNPLQCSCLENPRDGGAWWTAVYGVAQSWTRLKWLSSSSILIWMQGSKD